MKFYFRIEEPPEWLQPHIVKMLPRGIEYKQESGRALLVLGSGPAVPDEEAKQLIARECDRLFFISGVGLTAQLERIEHESGKLEGVKSHSVDTVVRPSDDTLKRIVAQDWGDARLLLQLRLWRLAREHKRNAGVYLMLLFQVVECEYPGTKDRATYPEYTDSSSPPSPYTETKLLRHLFSHQQGVPRDPELCKYCEFLEIRPPQFLNPSGAQVPRKLVERIPVVEQAARRIIDKKISAQAT